MLRVQMFTEDHREKEVKAAKEFKLVAFFFFANGPERTIGDHVNCRAAFAGIFAALKWAHFDFRCSVQRPAFPVCRCMLLTNGTGRSRNVFRIGSVSG